MSQIMAQDVRCSVCGVWLGRVLNGRWEGRPITEALPPNPQCDECRRLAFFVEPLHEQLGALAEALNLALLKLQRRDG